MVCCVCGWLSGRDRAFESEKLDFFDPFRLGDGRVMAFLLPGDSNGEVHKVTAIDKLSVVLTFLMAFLFLHETPNVKSVVGCVLITLGCAAMIL